MKRTFITFAITSLSVVSVFFAVPVHAQSTDAAQGIEISPAIIDLNAEKGKSYTLKLTVRNITQERLMYSSEINDFTSKDESGAPQVLIGSTLPDAASIVKWVSVEEEFSLNPREAITLFATVTIPSNAEPGGHYGAIRFSGHAPEIKETGVGLSASAGMLLLIRVNGDIKEEASLASFTSTSPTDKTKQTSFFQTSPIGFAVRIKNEGNVHVKPIGSIEMTDIFGNLVQSIPINEDKSKNVLPNSIRRFEAESKSSWMFGIYTANVTLGYGEQGQAITGTTTFWVLPLNLIGAGLLAIITLVFIASRLIKVYNRNIIAKARNEHNTKNKKSKIKKS